MRPFADALFARLLAENPSAPEALETVVLALSPEDLAPFGGCPGAWAFAPLLWPPGASFVARPGQDAILSSDDPADADGLLAGRDVLLFDRPALVRLNAWRSRARLPIVPMPRFRSLRARAIACGEPDLPTLEALGREGSTRHDHADTAGLPPAAAAVAWAVDVLCLLLGVEEQRRLMGVA